ncbi:hypothetical protein [Crenobacter caeni]|uniref:Uncharacterized protein n=1 Tax=Crenobacter caeni TaxID=2705474 RepID=A0A6B2KRZ1_9NEIS|nr:hypothetical protein [Crenobacter caeni]NDV12729.1 hypothetical protein [Crenobacter caeni]
MEWVAVVQQLNRDLLAIEIARSGLALQQRAIRAIPLIDQESSLPVSKSEFKELGSASIIAEQVSAEALIGLVANSIETFSIRIHRHLSVEWEPFTKPRNDLRFFGRPRQFRALNNVFKHQEGFIEAASSRSARFLVDDGYFPDCTYLKHLPASSIVPEFELAVFEAFAHLYEIALSVAGIPVRHSGKSGQDLMQSLREFAVFPIIEPTLWRS